MKIAIHFNRSKLIRPLHPPHPHLLVAESTKMRIIAIHRRQIPPRPLDFAVRQFPS